MGFFRAKGSSEPSNDTDAEERAKRYQAAIDHAVLSTPSMPNMLGAPGTVYTVGGSTYPQHSYDPATDTYTDLRTGQTFPASLLRGQIRPEPLPDLHDNNGRIAMINMRLRHYIFQHINTAFAGDKIYVFLIVNDQPVLLDDDVTMFPSDTLVTQLRMLMK